MRSELTARLTAALKRMAFFVIPAAMAFIALGDTIAAVLYQTGRFTREDTLYVWALLAGSGVGLLASTFGRLCSSAFYALRDTRTPLRFAIIRVVLTVGLGYLFAFPLPSLLHLDPKCGLPGLTASARHRWLGGISSFTWSSATSDRLISTPSLDCFAHLGSRHFCRCGSFSSQTDLAGSSSSDRRSCVLAFVRSALCECYVRFTNPRSAINHPFLEALKTRCILRRPAGLRLVKFDEQVFSAAKPRFRIALAR